MSGHLHTAAAVPLKKLVGPRNLSFLVILLELCRDTRQSIPGPLIVHLRLLFLCGIQIQCIVDGRGRHSVVFRRVTYHASWRAARNRCRQLGWVCKIRRADSPCSTWRDMTSFSMRLGEALVALCTPYLGTRQYT